MSKWNRRNVHRGFSTPRKALHPGTKPWPTQSLSCGTSNNLRSTDLTGPCAQLKMIWRRCDRSTNGLNLVFSFIFPVAERRLSEHSIRITDDRKVMAGPRKIDERG